MIAGCYHSVIAIFTDNTADTVFACDGAVMMAVRNGSFAESGNAADTLCAGYAARHRAIGNGAFFVLSGNTADNAPPVTVPATLTF